MTADLDSLLRRALGSSEAAFKVGQREAIEALLRPPHRALVIQATGWGKSMVYFIATRALRDAGRGPTLVLSPLLSLMRDQLRAAEKLGLNAARYSSDNSDQHDEIERDLRTDRVDMLFISPEQLASERFGELATGTSLAKAGLIVVDEAHCISDWGHDFRPDYQRIKTLIQRLPPATAVLATTATANDRVVADIREQIGASTLQRGPLARKSLRLQIIDGGDAAQRLAWLSDHLHELPGSGIIYTLTTGDADRVAAWLSGQGHSVLAYHSRLADDPGERRRLREEREGALLDNSVKALVATVALGMGFDKPDLGFVIHFQSPGNLVAYYQQVGRAGRAIRDALAIMCLGSEDEKIHQFFISSARPPEGQTLAVLEALTDAENGLSTVELEAKLNLPRNRVSTILKCLSVLNPSPVVKVGSKYQRTPTVYAPDLEREKALRERREAEHRRFIDFARTSDCLMMVTRRELDDPDAAPCGQCANCTGRALVTFDYSPATLQRAQAYLLRSEFPIEPRLRWEPRAFATESGFTGPIRPELRCAPGLCLSRWNEYGIGAEVRKGKDDGSFDEELVSASVAALKRMPWLAELSWVCSVPSLRHPHLVEGFAKDLASALGLEYVEAIEKVKETAPQKDQQNGFHQAHNLDGAFVVREAREGGVLLVDDMVDSRWTFTIIGALLRRAGATTIRPFALASTGHVRDDD